MPFSKDYGSCSVYRTKDLGSWEKVSDLTTRVKNKFRGDVLQAVVDRVHSVPENEFGGKRWN